MPPPPRHSWPVRLQGGAVRNAMCFHPHLSLPRTPKSSVTPYSRLTYPASHRLLIRQPQPCEESLSPRNMALLNSQIDLVVPAKEQEVKPTSSSPPCSTVSLRPSADLSPLLPAIVHDSSLPPSNSSSSFLEASLPLPFQPQLARGCPVKYP